MYEEYKIYGPYKRDDGRMHVVLVHSQTGLKRTISYPRFRITCIIGRELNDNEEVHHINNDVTNNEDWNFELIDKKIHDIDQRKHNAAVWICANCEKEFFVTAKQVSHRFQELKRKPNLKGPYCSRKCSGKQNN